MTDKYDKNLKKCKSSINKQLRIHNFVKNSWNANILFCFNAGTVVRRKHAMTN